MRFLLKSLKWLLLTVLLLLLLSAAAAYYLLGTESGYRQLPALINRFTPFTLSYDSLEGRFWGRQQWHNLQLEGPDGLFLRADQLTLEFAAADLWQKRLHIPHLELNKGVLHLPQGGARQPPAQSTPPTQLPQIELPLEVAVDDLQIRQLRIEQAGQEILTLDELHAVLEGQGSKLQLALKTALSQGSAQEQAPAAFDLKAQLAGDISLSGAYPLSLKGDAALQLPDQPLQEIDLAVGGSLLAPELSLQAQGWLEAALEGNAAIDLPGQSLSASLAWQEAALPGQALEIGGGQLAISGPFDDLRFSLSGGIEGGNIPAAAIRGSGRLSPAALRDAEFSIDTLGGSIDLQGFAEFGEALNWQADLRIQDIDARRYDPAIDARLNAHIRSEGSQQAGEPLQASFAIARLEGNWQEYPISGSGDIALAGSEMAIHDLQLNLAGNQVALRGGADARAVDIEADIDAAALARLLPMLDGAVKGTLSLRGAPHNPEIAADLHWQDLQVRQGQELVVASKSGALQSQGRVQDMQIALQGEARGRDFPPLKLSGTAKLQELQRVEDIAINADTMGGTAALRGRVEIAPELRWQAEAELRRLRPDFYLPEADAVISGNVRAEGGIDAQGTLHTQADVRELSGSWQGQPLGGGLKAQIEGGDVALREMDVRLGENRISGEAQLQGQALQGDIDLQALNLAQLHPQMRGVLRGKLALGGSAQVPEITADLKGEQLAFAENRVAAAEIVLSAGMRSGAAFNNRILLSGVEAGGQRWSSLRLETQGQYQQHSLSLNSEGGEYNLHMAAAGGFNAIDSWAGRINALEAQLQDLRWQLRRPSEVAVSPRAISLRDLCLADQYSAFCASLAHQEQTQIEYAIEQIDPRSLAPFMPENLKLDTLLTGEGKLTVAANGAIRGNADLQLRPGKITATVKGQPPIVLQLKEAVLNTQFNEQRSRSQLSVDFADTGTLRADIGIRDFANPQLSGELHLSVPDIGRFQHFLPQVSDLKGAVQGNMVFSGPLSAPQASGEILLDKGALKVPEYATELKNIRLRLSARRDGNIDIDGNIGTPKGSLQANGVLRLQPLTLNLQLRGREMLLANAKTMRLLASPSFDVRIDPDSGVIIKGDIHIPEAAVAIPDTRNAVAISEDVVIVNSDTPADAPYVEPANSPVQADISVRLGDKVFFKDPNMNIRLMGGIDIVIRPGAPLRGRGRIEVASGYYELYGQELNIKRGWVTFSDELANPAIDIIAMREVDDVEAGAQLSGTVKRMRLDLTSDPAMPDSAVLSYLIFGRAPDSATDSTALLQTAAVIGTKGLFPDDLAAQTGLDVFDLGVGGLKAGKYLMEDLYVGIKSNFFTGVTQFLGRYRLTDRLSIEASSSSLDGNAVDMIYEFETD